MQETIRLNSVGRALQVRFVDALTGLDFDISGATSLTFVLTKSDGVTYNRAGSLLAGSTSIATYDLVADDTDTLGILEWFVTYIEAGSGTSIPTEKFRNRIV